MESSSAAATGVTRESLRLLRLEEGEEGEVEVGGGGQVGRAGARSGSQVTFQKHDCAEAGGVPEPHRPGSRDVGTELVTRGGRAKGDGAKGKHERQTARGVHWID